MNWYNFFAIIASIATFTLIVVLILPRFKNHTRFICSWADSKVGGLLITLLGVMWAAQVSIYANELRVQISSANIKGDALTFITLIYTVLILVLSKEIGQSERISKKESKLSKQLTHLPPKKILSYISDQKEIISQLVQTCRLYYFISINNISSDNIKNENKTLKEISDNIIKDIIKSICKASALWDDDFEHNNLKYSANVFIPSKSEHLIRLAELKPDNLILKSIKSSPFFMLSDNIQSKIEHCDGVLFCQRQFSVSYTEKEQFEVSAESCETVICIPYRLNSSPKQPVCQPNFFGAPEAFVNSRVEYVRDSAEALERFLNRVKNNTPFSDHITKKFEQEIKNYYSNDTAKSIISIPLFRYENPFGVSSQATEDIIGVLNIYRNKTDILMTEERGNVFHELIRPLCFNLSYVLSLIQMYEKHSTQAATERRQ